MAGCTCFPSHCKVSVKHLLQVLGEAWGSCANLLPLPYSFPPQQFLHVHHGGCHDRLVHGQDLGGSAGGGCWSPAGLALQCSSGVRRSFLPFVRWMSPGWGEWRGGGENQQGLSCQPSPGSLLQAPWLLKNSGWEDFLALT